MNFSVSLKATNDATNCYSCSLHETADEQVGDTYKKYTGESIITRSNETAASRKHRQTATSSGREAALEANAVAKPH